MREGKSWQRELADQAKSLDPRQLSAFLRFHEIVSDDDLCDAIDIDARGRASNGQPVSFERYLEAIPTIEGRRLLLDVAIEASLRALRRDGIEAPRAVASLKSQYPHLSQHIDTAAVFDDFLSSSASHSSSDRPSPEPTPPPTTLGDLDPAGQRRYLLVRPLGQGSQAVVYLAVDGFLSAPDQPAWVAIKVFPRRPRDEAESIAVSESRAVRRIDHPNVVHVLDRGRTDEGCEFVVFEFVEGSTLQRTIESQGKRIEPREAARIVAALAHGLQAAHNAGVLHRDLKPSNVLMARSGQVKIADFGLADRVRVYGPARGPAGSFAFMSPEQYRCDPRAFFATSDVYSLGGILFWLLTGRLPNGEDSASIEQRLWKGESALPLDPVEHAPRLDPDLGAICRRAVAPNPLDRYQSAEALANDLERFLARRPIDWTKPSRVRRARLFAARAPLAATLAVFGMTALIVGASLATSAWHAKTVNALEHKLSLAAERAGRAESEREAALQRGKIDGVIEMIQASRIMLRDPTTTPNDGWLRSTIVTEVIFGPVVLGLNEDRAPLWRDRIATVKTVIAEASAAGREDTFEVMGWQALLGYWQVRASDFEEARLNLDKALAAWTPRLSPDDPFLSDLHALRAAADLGAAGSAASVTPEELNRLRDAVESLRRHDAPEHLRETLDQVLSKVS